MAVPKPCHCDRLTLDNGLTVLISDTPRLPLLSIGAFVVAGSDQNPDQLPGLAALTSRLLDEGTCRYSSRQISELLENAGGTLSTFSQRELSGIHLQLRVEDLELGLDLLSETLIRPVFPREKMEFERERVLNRLEAMADDPHTVASTLFDRLVYRNSPFQHPVLGTRHGVRKIRHGDITEFHRTKYAPQNTIVLIVGNVRSQNTAELAGRYLGSWTNDDFSRRELILPVQQEGRRRKTLSMDKEQIHIYIGHIGVSRSNPDIDTLQVLDVILGNGPGFTSRIPRKLRDEQGLAYTTFADISSSSSIYPGRFVAYISTSPENRETAVEGLLTEINEIRENGVTIDELETAQDYLTGSFVFDLESHADLTRFLLSIELFNLGDDYASRYPGLIRAVRCEDVQRVAVKYLDTINYSTVMVGPLNEA